MEAAAIIQLISILLPVAQKAGLDLFNIIEGINSGKSVDELIAEAEAKRNDLESLKFE